jgi:flagellar basal-body rod modification protein FlgD
MNISTTGNTLGKDEFLKLFTYQLKYQDPLSPLDSTEFTSQLAQFTSLEQLYNMNENFQQLLSFQVSLNNGIATSLLGKEVKLNDGTSGLVTGIIFEDGSTFLQLDNEKKVLLSDIQEIYSPSSE